MVILKETQEMSIELLTRMVLYVEPQILRLPTSLIPTFTIQAQWISHEEHVWKPVQALSMVP